MSVSFSKVHKAYLSPHRIQAKRKRSSIKLPDIHRIHNISFSTKRSTSHISLQNSISDTQRRPSNRQRTAEHKSKRPLQLNTSSPTSAVDEDLTKLESLTVRNASARYDLISLQERMLEIKLKSLIRHNRMKSIEELEDSNLFEGIESCYSNSKKSIDGLLKKYKGFGGRSLLPALTSPVNSL
jgi:hypothetical protein